MDRLLVNIEPRTNTGWNTTIVEFRQLWRHLSSSNLGWCAVRLSISEPPDISVSSIVVRTALSITLPTPKTKRYDRRSLFRNVSSPFRVHCPNSSSTTSSIHLEGSNHHSSRSLWRSGRLGHK
ncbi:hypothetical protein JAAARDRAFT_500686 [Jaapia argillacea MUCL 33604]|uniref:Uncharacterized protein n=1 Tax=Jaapia argillacea MUCL 33604 TaxID=933084 RepID=A0A067PKS8_9AGAM|nr:hypothetical protein JAAARDRAFT_500686 [Jaapia argillacea MUCL 33604]